jgi:hypothetical protein
MDNRDQQKKTDGASAVQDGVSSGAQGAEGMPVAGQPAPAATGFHARALERQKTRRGGVDTGPGGVVGREPGGVGASGQQGGDARRNGSSNQSTEGANTMNRSGWDQGNDRDEPRRTLLRPAGPRQ